MDGLWINRLPRVSRRACAIWCMAFGIGLLRSWQSWVLQVFKVAFSNEGIWVFSIKTFFDMGQLVGAIIGLILIVRAASLLRYRTVVFGAPLLLLCGTLVAALAKVGFVQMPVVVSATLFLVVGVGYTGAFLLWIERCGLVPPLFAMMACLGSYVANSMCWFFFQGLPDGHASVLAGVLLVASFLLYMGMWVFKNSDNAEERIFRNPAGRFGVSRAFLWIWLFSAIYGVGASFTQMGYASLAVRLGVASATVLLLVCLFLFRERVDFSVVYRLVFAGMALGFAVDLLGFGGLTFMQVCFTASETMVMVFAFTLCCGMAYSNRVSAAVFYAIVRIGCLASVIAMRYLCDAILRISGESEKTVLVIVVLMMAVLVLAAALFKKIDFLATWDSVRDAEGDDLMCRACRQIVVSGGLGERESSILLLLARDRSPAEIAEQLFIAPGTVRAHVDHIYKKLDVHSREQLKQLVKDTAESL